LHIAVLESLKDALVHRSDIAPAMSKAMKTVLKEQSHDDSEDVARELKAANAQHLRLTRKLTGDDEDDKEVNAELDALDASIARLRAKSKSKPKVDAKLKPEVTAARLAKQFAEMGGGVDEMDVATKKALLKCLISRMVVDLETREVEMDLALPADLHALLASTGKNTVVARLCSLSSHGSAAVSRPIFASFVFKYDWESHAYGWKRRKSA
jgi:hypothetical protein